MNEFEQILVALRGARQRSVACTLATVVAVEGSTYRRPGARMLIADDGATIGTISGGCLEKELQKKASWIARDGRAVLVRFDTTSEDEVVWEFGLGCRGVVYVLLERVLPGGDFSFFDAVDAAMRARRPLSVETVIVSTHADHPVGFRRWDASPIAAGPRIFRETIEPPIHLLICGGGHDAVPVSESAAALGWHVTVFDSRASYAATSRFPNADRVVAGKPASLTQHVAIDNRTVAVVMSHNFYDDRIYARELLASSVAYIGLLGPRTRSDELLESLADDGVPIRIADDPRIFAPVGLDVGAETPQEIAIAIVAEIQSALAGQAGGRLRDRTGPIHTAALPLANQPIDALRTGGSCPI